MPDDNSCLFRAVAYCVLRNIDAMTELRSIIASTIQNNPIEYNAALLGRKSVDDYCQWISREDSWGGGIEISILAKHFNTEIVSVDVQSGRLDKFTPEFNTGDERTRCFVLYSGIHYDAIVWTPLTGSNSNEFDQTLFPIPMSDDFPDDITPAVLKLAAHLREQKYYTDTQKFTIKCQTCGETFTGEKGAISHAKATNHWEFGETN